MSEFWKETANALIKRLGGYRKVCTLAESGKLDQLMDVSLEKVFAKWDLDKSGTLESSECVCNGSKSADSNGDARVTMEEMSNLAEDHFGSVDKFVAVVRAHGGVEAFYEEVSADACTIGAVFTRFDRNNNGSLESYEWDCGSSRMADSNRDGKITQREMEVLVARAFGSVARFEQYVQSQGGAAKFVAQHR